MEMALFFILCFLLGALLGGIGVGYFAWQTKTALIQSRSELASTIATHQGQLQMHQAQLAMKDEQLAGLQKSTQANELYSQQLQAQMAQKFEALAGKIFEERTDKLQDLSTKTLATVLDPFKERLKDFEKKVEDSYSFERTERGSLRGELSKLMELNLKMSSEAENLTRALRGDNRAQGAWGEMVLENILQRSGLRRGEEYTIQATDMSLRNEAGEIIRPDVIIHLPENKHLIIDSKVSLNAYEQYLNTEDPAEREKLAKVHTESLRAHINSLANKKYHTVDSLTSPDFVLLFMPVEPAFALAMRQRPEIHQEAWEKNVALVSPTTLLVTLKMVSAIWKTERQERNALEIAEKGGQLYDKFVGLVNDLETMGKKIDDSQKAYSGVMNKLKDGKGNLLRQVDMLRDLGVKTSKRLQLENDTPSLE